MSIPAAAIYNMNTNWEDSSAISLVTKVYNKIMPFPHQSIACLRADILTQELSSLAKMGSTPYSTTTLVLSDVTAHEASDCNK